MSSYSDYASSLARIGEAHAQALQDIEQRSAQIAANAALNRGQIWGGAVQGIGQNIAAIPQQMQAQKEQALRQQIGQLQLTEGQMNVSAQQRALEMQQRANQVISTLPRNANGTYDTGALTQQLASSGVTPDEQARLAKTFDDLNTIAVKANESKANHLADVADTILKAHPDGEPITPDAVHVGLAAAKSMGVMNDDEQQQLLQLLSTGTDPSQVLKAVRGLGTKYSGPHKFESAPAGSQIYDTSTGAPSGTPSSKPITNAMEAALIAVAKDPARPTPEETAKAIQLSREPKALQSESVLLDGKPAKVNFDPVKGTYTDTSGNDVSSRVKPLPPASIVYPKPEAQATEIKPGTPEYKVAQDLATGKLTFSQFRTLSAYSRDTGKKMGIYALAGDLNPEFNPSQFELGFKMASNPQIRQRVVAINSLEPVIRKAQELAKQVGNGDVQAFNRIIQGAKLQISNRPVANFRQLQILLGEEIGNALGLGTGSDLKTKLGIDIVNPYLSPAAFGDNLDQIFDVLAPRRSELIRQMGVYGTVAQPATGSNPAPASTGAPSYQDYLKSRGAK